MSDEIIVREIDKSNGSGGILRYIHDIAHGDETPEVKIQKVKDLFEKEIIQDENAERKDGLTPEEGEVMDALILAWNKFTKLEVQHPMHNTEFCHGIHQCQRILCMRILRREYPEGYPTYKKE